MEATTGGGGRSGGLAIAALVCGIVAAVFGLVPFVFILGWLLAVVAIVLGLMGRRSPRRTMAGWGVGLGGLALLTGVVGLVASLALLDADTFDGSGQSSSEPSTVERRRAAQEGQQDEPPIETYQDDSLGAGSEDSSGEMISMGRPARSGDIKLTVLDARAESSLRYTDDMGDAKTKRAKQGGRYVLVKTRITNETSKGLDLTCGFEVDGKLVDDSGREFDPIDELYSIKGNPECNDMLQPGFKDAMTWVYLVPRGAEVSTFKFSDVTDLETEHPPAEVSLTGV